jgi:two-component system response regulator RegA
MLDRPRVLIVEDDTPTRNALSRIFAREGWDVRTASTLSEGLAALDPPPNCVVLDLSLPDGPGDVILKTIRMGALPIRMVAVTTGVSDPARWAQIARYQPNALLTKPIDPEALCRLCAMEIGG